MIIIDGYVIDAAISEEDSLNSEVTSNPVEEGIDTTDNVRLLPDVLALECAVSNTPTTAVQTARGSSALTNATSSLPSDEAYEKLKAMRRAKKRVEIVVSDGRRYVDMVCTKIGVPRSIATLGGLRFRVSFQQIEVVKNERTTVRTEQPRGQKKKRRGNKPSAKATTPLGTGVKLKGRNADTWLGDFLDLVGG